MPHPNSTFIEPLFFAHGRMAMCQRRSGGKRTNWSNCDLAVYQTNRRLIDEVTKSGDQRYPATFFT
jgi:hypothetical protein